MLLDDLKTDHTLIVITHNKDIMKATDKLIVLNNGKIECTGKHEDLIKNNEFYRQLYNNYLLVFVSLYIEIIFYYFAIKQTFLFNKCSYSII